MIQHINNGIKVLTLKTHCSLPIIDRTTDRASVVPFDSALHEYLPASVVVALAIVNVEPPV